ncbi:MFS transporter [Uliginosibacterium sp. H1]|uniref:MFS transporter n=1 Tax=Uliginosibacterium sp. H1 TaxID=3114757 RepID=UPI002E189844|nr:MFS transporter [Uliginosibacterium sp. H1]
MPASAGPATGATSDLVARLDRLPLTRMHLLVMVVCAAGFAFDLMEIALGSVMSAVFSAPPHAVGATQLSWLLAAVYIGAVAGAPLLGRLADRVGRRVCLSGVLLLLAVSSFAAAASPDVFWLTVCRVISGIALGAFPPLMIAYLTDLLPPLNRGRLIFVVVAFASLGPPLGVLMVRALMPVQPLGIDAWRWGLFVGGVGALVVAALFRRLPESPRWLIAQGREQEALAAGGWFLRSRPLRAAGAFTRLVPPPTEMATGRGRLSLVAALFFLSPWSTVAFPLLSGALLVGKGFRLQDSLLYVAFSSFGPVVGTLAAALVVDRMERRVAMALCAVAMLASGWLFITWDSPGGLVAASILFSLFGALYVPSINVYGAELVPTRGRAAAIAGCWALNRLGAAIAPLLLVPLLRNSGPQTMFVVIAASLIATLALLSIAPRGAARQAVA